METREEGLAKWADPSTDRSQSLRVLTGSLVLNSDDLYERIRISEDQIQFEQIAGNVLNNDGDPVSHNEGNTNLWHFKAISLSRLQPGRLNLSIPKAVFQQIQDSWSLHPRTIEVFLSNNGVFTTFRSSNGERTSLLLKVANSRSTGFDCVSVTCDPARRTTYALYHHLEDEASVFATLLATPDRCIDPYFFVAALYRSHHQHIEIHRNTIDDAIQSIERQTGFGRPGRLENRRLSFDSYPNFADPKSVIQQLSFCQTDLAIIGHVARCCLDCGEWLVKPLEESLSTEQQSPPHRREQRDMSRLDQQTSQSLKMARSLIREDVEYTRRRSAMLLSHVQQMRERVQSQTGFMLNTIMQSDSEYTAAIAVDGKRDSTAMKTIAVLGIVFLPGTFVATLFSINMFDWGFDDQGQAASLTVSQSMWIYWAITVPLTIVTFLFWLFWSRRENQKSTKRLKIYRSKTPADSDCAAAIKISELVVGEKTV